MLSHVKYRNYNFTRIEKMEIISRHHKVKKNGPECSLFEKIYNALFYFLLEYIHQLSMLSHGEYRNPNFT